MEDEIFLNVCNLQPPEPMEQVLEKLSLLQPNQRLRMLIDREPRPLYRILSNNGFSYRTEAKPDYLYEILIWHKT